MIGLFGQEPRVFGVIDGTLAQCPASSNCVSSTAPVGDQTHYVEPLRFAESPSTAWRRLCDLIEHQPRARIVQRSETYLHVEFRTRVFRFVDDVELLLDAAGGLIHVRSASRLGKADLGTNRRRIEALRRHFGTRSDS